MRIPLIPIVVGLVLGCQAPKGAEYRPKATTITRACFDTPPDSIALAMIRARVRDGGIKFNPVVGAADSQIVDLSATARPVRYRRAGRVPVRPKALLVQAVIEPEESSWSIDMDAARAHHWSCIIAQIRTAHEVAAGDLRLGAWNTWGIVRHDGKAWMSTYVAGNEKGDTQRGRPHRFMRPDAHPEHRWNQSIARFQHSDLWTWGVCGDMCCNSPVQEQ